MTIVKPKKKLCPLKANRGPQDKCDEFECAWWVIGYTEEGNQIQCCAMEFIAMKTGSGQYRV